MVQIGTKNEKGGNILKQFLFLKKINLFDKNKEYFFQKTRIAKKTIQIKLTSKKIKNFANNEIGRNFWKKKIINRTKKYNIKNNTLPYNKIKKINIDNLCKIEINKKQIKKKIGYYKYQK